MSAKASRSCTERFYRSLFISFSGIAVLAAGCGGAPQIRPPIAVTITAQPVSQTVPIGEAATFNVTASGTGPLSYQWSENGVEIPGATSSLYITPPVALNANESTIIASFQVIVSNASSSATSSAAILTAGPRSPKARDLRYLLFQQVSLPGLLADGGLESGVSCGGDCSASFFNNAVGTQLDIGDGNCNDSGSCGWAYDIFDLPSPLTGLTMYYRGDSYSSFASDMQDWVGTPNAVVTSLDFEPNSELFAVSWVQTAQAGGFDYKLEIVPQAQLSATAAADGAESRVITATSFDASGNANLISYGWTGDTTTKYETQTAVAQNGGVCSAAAALAQSGYVISAFGGNDTDGFILVGVRVSGDSLPRSINDTETDEPPYFTTVVSLTDSEGKCYVNEQ